MAGKKFHVPRDVDSGKMGTATSLNRVVCGEQHHRGPLIKFLLDADHNKKSCCGLQLQKFDLGFSFFFNGLQRTADSLISGGVQPGPGNHKKKLKFH